jgi:hypothetical protein
MLGAGEAAHLVNERKGSTVLTIIIIVILVLIVLAFLNRGRFGR